MLNLVEYLLGNAYIRRLTFKDSMEINPRGRIVTVIYSAKAMRYDMADYWKRIKKVRKGYRGRKGKRFGIIHVDI
jgi:hypothetical protein